MRLHMQIRGSATARSVILSALSRWLLTGSRSKVIVSGTGEFREFETAVNEAISSLRARGISVRIRISFVDPRLDHAQQSRLGRRLNAIDGVAVIGAPPSTLKRRSAPPVTLKRRSRRPKHSRSRTVKTLSPTTSDAEIVQLKISPKPPSEPPRLHRIFYATNREPTGNSDPRKFYGIRRSERLRYGFVDVSIPSASNRKLGTLPRPRWSRLEFSEDPKKHVVIRELKPISWSAVVRGCNAHAKKTDVNEGLIVIHGYNVTFAQAALRAGQLVNDVGFEGQGLLFSWPSKGQRGKYLPDKASIEGVAEIFSAFVEKCCAELGFDRLHIIAHSMGSHAIVTTLGAMRRDTLKRIGEVVFAAPDVDRDAFTGFIKKLPARHPRVTLYASHRDRALKVSAKLTDAPRAGLAGESLIVMNRLETIDASDVETAIFGARHSGFTERRALLSDLYGLFVEKKSADRRFGVESRTKARIRYWYLQPGQ